MPKKKDTKKAEEMLGDLSGHLLNDMRNAVEKVEKQPATPAAGLAPSSFPSLDAQGIPIKQLKSILDALVELESLSNAVERRGVNFSKYIGFRHKKTKKLPLYMVKVEYEDHFLYNDDELAEYVKQDERALKKETKEKEGEAQEEKGKCGVLS